MKQLGSNRRAKLCCELRIPFLIVLATLDDSRFHLGLGLPYGSSVCRGRTLPRSSVRVHSNLFVLQKSAPERPRTMLSPVRAKLSASTPGAAAVHHRYQARDALRSCTSLLFSLFLLGLLAPADAAWSVTWDNSIQGNVGEFFTPAWTVNSGGSSISSVTFVIKCTACSVAADVTKTLTLNLLPTTTATEWTSAGSKTFAVRFSPCRRC